MLGDGKEKSSNKECIFFWFSVYEMCPPILVCEPCTTNLIAAQLSTSLFFCLFFLRNHLRKRLFFFKFLFIFIFIFGCVGSSFLCEGFL